MSGYVSALPAAPPPPLPARPYDQYHAQQDPFQQQAQTQEQQQHYQQPYTYSQPTASYGGAPYGNGTANSAAAAAPASANVTNGYAYTDYANQERGRFNLTKKARKRLYWMLPLAILVLVLIILFEVFKSDFERWVSPLTRWLQARKSWSWLLPVAILVVLSFPPLFGHEIVQIVVGLTYPLGVAFGIACAGAIIGEAACFIVFKYIFSGYVDRKRARLVKWEATARVCRDAGFWGVMLIRYSIVPPHLANPLFATTGMSFFIYMVSVILSLPKTIVFVALGNPNNSHKSGTKVAKVIAVGILLIVTLYASWWIRGKMNAAKAEVRAERGVYYSSDETPKPSVGMPPANGGAYKNNSYKNQTTYGSQSYEMGDQTRYGNGTAYGNTR